MRLPFAVLALALVSCGGDKNDSSGSGSGGGAGGGPTLPEGNIAFELRPSTVDLGMLQPREVVESQFELVNTGEVPLRGLEIEPNCGCLRFDFDRSEIPVGGSRVIPFTVGTGRDSQKALQAAVRSRHGRMWQATLSIIYYAIPQLHCREGGLSFGRLEKADEPLEQTITVAASVPEGTPASPLSVTVSEGCPVQVRVGEISEQPVGGMLQRSVELHCSLDRSEAVGEVRGQLMVEGDWIVQSSLPVRGMIHAGLYFDTEQVHFGRVRMGRDRPTSREVRLFYTGAEAPSVEKMECEPDCFSASHRVEADTRSIVVELSYQPSATDEQTGELKVFTSSGEEPLVLKLAGRGR